MQHQEFEPPAALRDAIQCFWYDRRDLGPAPSTFEVLPDGYAEIVFHFGGAGICRDGGVEPLPSPCIVGLLDGPVRLCAQERFEVIGIRCFPWTVFDLLGLAPSRQAVHALAHPIAALQATLQAHLRDGRIDAALARLERYLLDVRAGTAPDGALARAGTALRAAHGALRVDEVAALAHATVRTLERKFKQASGHTVKDVAGLMRFEQVRNRLWLDPDAGIAALAQLLGYADQSHLSREFKRYSGTTPAAFARRARGRQREGGGGP